MKETVITPGMKRRELILLLVCFIAAFILNVIGIIKYKTPAIEMVTELHIVLLVSLVIYAIVGVLRLLFYLVSRIWVRKQ